MFEEEKEKTLRHDAIYDVFFDVLILQNIYFIFSLIHGIIGIYQ